MKRYIEEVQSENRWVYVALVIQFWVVYSTEIEKFFSEL